MPYTMTVDPNGVSETAPLVYMFDVTFDGQTHRYVGKSVNGSRRPRKDYAAVVSRLMNGAPYRKGNPDGFRRVHRVMAEALRAGGFIHLTLVENCTEDRLNRREREIAQEVGANLNVLWTFGLARKCDTITPNRRRALGDFLAAEDPGEWRSGNGQRWGAACHAYAALTGLTKSEAATALTAALIP
jgi:hypothetical protein